MTSRQWAEISIAFDTPPGESQKPGVLKRGLALWRERHELGLDPVTGHRTRRDAPGEE